MTALNLNSVGIITLHHAAFEWPDHTPLQSIYRDICSWHVDRGFKDIGYHFIAKGDQWMRGRAIHVRGAHVKGWNKKSLGICVAGDLTKRKPTVEDIASVCAIVQETEKLLRRRFAVVGHNQLAKTLCPGPALVNAVNEELYKLSLDGIA